MAEYAYIFDNQIKEIVDLDPSIHAQWVAANNPKASSYLPIQVDPVPVYDPATQTVDSTHVVGVSVVMRKWVIRALTSDELRKTWTSYEFLGRFTPAERAAIRSGATTDPVLADFLMMSQAAQEVVSDDPMTVAGMDYLVAVGVLTAGRRNEILS